MAARLNDTRSVARVESRAVVIGLALCVVAPVGCDSRLVIATTSQSPDSASCSNVNVVDASVSDGTTSFASPWTTGFEDGFCDYADRGGFCYAAANSMFEIVNAPVHSGRFAAAFTVTADPNALQVAQARCVRQGPLPAAATYGAWYYVPSANKNTAFWNLIHFRGGSPTTDSSSDDGLHGLWDISLVNDAKGGLRLSVWDFLRNAEPSITNEPSIPLGQWFHVEVYLKRASDASGEFALYQDGVPILQLPNLATDDTEWGRWYVGNLAVALDPPESTIYVDDLTIGAPR